jgi:hypothetical protein
VLVPSKELGQEFFYYGLNTIPIQLGIDFDMKSRDEKLDKIKNKKIISGCTAEEGIYHYIKGIDQFSKLMKDLKLDKQSLVLGNNNQLFEGIDTKKVSRKTFLKRKLK